MRTTNFGKCRKMLGLLVRDAQALARLEATHGRLPATWALETPEGSLYLFAAPPQVLRGRASAQGIDGVTMIHGIELSSDGRYIRIPPATKSVRIGRHAS